MSDGAVMTFQEHLTELRTRIMRSILAVVIGFFCCWSFRIELFEFLAGPISRALADNGIYHYQAIQVTESVMVYLKTSFVFSVILTSPFTFYQFWAFISPALERDEKTFVIPVTLFTVIFFLIGSAFSYQVILPFVTDWLTKLSLQGGNVEMVVTLQNAYSTAFLFLLMFGLVFQLPLVIFFLSLFGVVTARGLARFFRYFVVISVIIGAALTPPDPLSQALMALPLNVLYGFGIFIAWGIERSREKAGDGPAPSAGITLTRLMGASLLLLGLAVGLVVLFIRSLPEPDFVRGLPPEATWIISGNPAVLEEVGAFQEALRANVVPPIWADVEEALGTPLSSLRETALFGTEAGQTALMIRADGLALGLAALSELEGIVSGATDQDTLILGDEALVNRTLAVARGEVDARELSKEEERLVETLRTSGPLWAWVPHGTNLSPIGVGKETTIDAAAMGAWLQLGDITRVTLVAHAIDRLKADGLESAMHRFASQVELMGSQRDPHTERLAMLVAKLTSELKGSLRGPAQARLGLIEAELLKLQTPQSAASSPRPSSLLSTLSGRGWSLTRDEVRMSLTTTVEDADIVTLSNSVLAQLPTRDR